MSKSQIQNLGLRPLAYSYLRFSRPEQELGNSADRQISRSKEYAVTHGLELMESIEDRGVSAFEGRNFAVGNLGKFFERVQAKEIPEGSYLLVESLDRLSRQDVEDALVQFLKILGAGIVIVTIGADERVFKKGSLDQMSLIMALLIMTRANEESKTKRDRLQKAWEKKRDKIAHEKMTKRCPAWLKLSGDRKSFALMDSRVEELKQIYQWAADGMGTDQIARKLNRANRPAWLGKKGWHKSTIQKLLTSRAVIGEFQPHFRKDGKTGKRLPAGSAIIDYYPPVIDSGLFHRVAAVRAERKRLPGKVGKNISNLFSHLCQCGYCGEKVVFSNKGKWKYLVCESARRGRRCDYVSWPYAEFEHLFADTLRLLDLEAVLGTKGQGTLNGHHASLAAVEQSLSANEKSRARIVGAIEEGADAKPSMLISRLNSLEKQSEDLEKQKKEIIASIHREQNAVASFNDSARWEEVLTSKGSDFEFRLRLREEIRRKVSRIRVYARGRQGIRGNGIIGELDWDELNSHYPTDARQMEVTFRNGAILLLGEVNTPAGKKEKFYASLAYDESDEIQRHMDTDTKALSALERANEEALK